MSANPPKKRRSSTITGIIDLVFLTLFGILAMNPNFQEVPQEVDKTQLLRESTATAKDAATSILDDLGPPQSLYLYCSTANVVHIRVEAEDFPLEKLSEYAVHPHIKLIFGDVPARSIARCLEILRKQHSIETLDLHWQERQE